MQSAGVTSRRGFRRRAIVLSQGGRKQSSVGPCSPVPPLREVPGSSVAGPSSDPPSCLPGRKGLCHPRPCTSQTSPPAQGRGLTAPSSARLSWFLPFLRLLFSSRGSVGVNPLCFVGVNIPLRGVYSFTVSVTHSGAHGTSRRHFLQGLCCLFRPHSHAVPASLFNGPRSEPDTLPLALSRHDTSGCSSSDLTNAAS